MGVLIVLTGDLPPPIIGLITGGFTGSDGLTGITFMGFTGGFTGSGRLTGVGGVYGGLTGVDEDGSGTIPLPLNCWQMNQKTM
ncbi:MAG: hypothetical protein PQ975_07000 [Methanobacterium sp.]|jgi:hypothetical protein